MARVREDGDLQFDALPGLALLDALSANTYNQLRICNGKS
jgi:hypothetical protein